MNLKRFLLLLSFMLLVSGCSFIRVTNLSDLELRVQVLTPDSGSASTRSIGSVESVDVFSTHGGRYVVSILPNEEYRNLLEEIREEISRKLFEERASLSGDDIARLTQNLSAINDQLELLSNQGASCAGNLPEFDTIIVNVSWSDEENNWQLACP